MMLWQCRRRAPHRIQIWLQGVGFLVPKSTKTDRVMESNPQTFKQTFTKHLLWDVSWLWQIQLSSFYLRWGQLEITTGNKKRGNNVKLWKTTNIRRQAHSRKKTLHRLPVFLIVHINAQYKINILKSSCKHVIFSQIRSIWFSVIILYTRSIQRIFFSFVKTLKRHYKK